MERKPKLKHVNASQVPYDSKGVVLTSKTMIRVAMADLKTGEVEVQEEIVKQHTSEGRHAS